MMNSLRKFVLALLFISGLQPAFAQDLNPQVNNSLLPERVAQMAANARILSNIDENYSGNRKLAAEHILSRGWLFLRQGNRAEAMRLFNQVLLLDDGNGSALLGMANAKAKAKANIQTN